MKKYDLLRNNETIIRILEIQPGRVLIIDCIKRSMPVWGSPAILESFAICAMEDLGTVLPTMETLNTEQRKTMYERYTLIAPILPFIADEKMRSQIICSTAEVNGISKQTIRNHLCRYLAYMDIAVLAPKKNVEDVTPSQDEKNMRWALNKFFYTTQKQSLHTAYALMLKEKYCDSMGALLDEYPSFYQLRYFYRKTRKMQNYYISRNGLTHYQRNNRPLLGDGVQEFAPTVGVGMLDATICDIYLVNEAGSLVGRPVPADH